MRCRIHPVREWSIATKIAALVIATAIAFASASPAVFRLQGADGLRAAALAATLCLLGATLALAIGQLSADQRFIMPALCLGTALRMGIPLITVFSIHLHGGPLAEAGLIYYLLVFYPVTLLVETALSLPGLSPRTIPATTSPRTES